MFQLKSSPRMLNVATTAVKGFERALLVFFAMFGKIVKTTSTPFSMSGTMEMSFWFFVSNKYRMQLTEASAKIV